MTPKQIIDSLIYLADHCDGAGAKDGAGFNKADSSFGKDLAGKAKRIGLSAGQMEAARKILVKYAKQLQGAGIV